VSAVSTRSTGFTLSLTEEERTQLRNYLEQGLRDVLIEVHRTEAPDFRVAVERKEAALRSILDKLRQT